MSILDLLNLVNDIEKNYPVSEWRIDNVDVWPLLRIYIIQRNMITEYNRHASKGNNRLEYVYRGLLSGVIDRKNHANNCRADVIMLGSNADRTIKLESGERVSQNLDSIRWILERSGIECFVLEDIQGAELKLPRYSKSDFTISGRALFVTVKNKLFKKKTHDCWLPGYNEVGEYIARKELDNNLLAVEVLCGAVDCFNDMADYFEKIIQKKKIRLAMLVCWYNEHAMALSLACRRNNIFCVDIQHGSAGANLHEAYAKWCNVPFGGYNTMPTHFWAWTQKDVNAIECWYNKVNGGLGKSFIGGVTAEAAYGTCAVGLKEKWDELLNPLLVSEKIQCLLTLQTGYDLPTWVRDAISDTKDCVKWFIRKHPVEDAVQNNFIKNVEGYENVEWEIASECPLCILLKHMEYHVTMHSSCVLDALRQNVKSVLLTDLGKQTYIEEINEGKCFFADNKDALIAIIANVAGCIEKEEVIENCNLPGISEVLNILND